MTKSDEQLLIICRNVRYIRKTLNLTKREMAKRMGTSVYTLSKLEAEDFPPRLGIAECLRLAPIFGCPISRLFTPLYE